MDELSLEQALSMYAPEVQLPQDDPVMLGTVTNEEMAKRKKQQMLANALRELSLPKQAGGAQMAGNRVVSAGSVASGMDAGAIGKGLGGLFGGGGNPAPADLAGTSYI